MRCSCTGTLKVIEAREKFTRYACRSCGKQFEWRELRPVAVVDGEEFCYLEGIAIERMKDKNNLRELKGTQT